MIAEEAISNFPILLRIFQAKLSLADGTLERPAFGTEGENLYKNICILKLSGKNTEWYKGLMNSYTLIPLFVLGIFKKDAL